MSGNLIIRKTADGSTTLLHEGLNETYHSVHGALTESLHVFIEKGARFAAEKFSGSTLEILEIGFGTGLNACLTRAFATAFPVAIRYCSIEKYPLPEEIWRALEFPDIDPIKLSELHQAPWNVPVKFDSDFELLKMEGDVTQQDFASRKFNVIYFDAFAPNKQPELWTPAIFSAMYEALKDEGLLVTYCAKGQFKRDLRSVGFIVESLPGPPGKREMVRAFRR